MTNPYPGYKFQKEILPCYSDLYCYSGSVVLAGILYRIKLQYNRRGQFWALSIFDSNGGPLIRGRKMVLSWPFLDNIPQCRPADGQLIAFGDVDVPVLMSDLGEGFVPAFLSLTEE
jgi:hypothetical protein